MTKREKILETMLQLVAKQGIQGTPMSQISKESGVATGTIYHHFKSKEEIINEIYLEKKKDFQKIIAQHLNEAQSIEVQFSNLWIGLYQYYIENPLIFAFSLQLTGTPIIKKETVEEGLNYYEDIVAFFKKGTQSGDFVKMDARLISELLHANIIKLAELKINERIDVTPKVLKSAIDFSWRAIKI